MSFDQADMPDDMELEDWIPVLEPLENNEAFSEEDMLYRIEEEPAYENEAGIEMSLAEGENDTIYNLDETNGSLWFQWGPVHAENGVMLGGHLISGGDHGGEAVTETEAEIASQYSAPYINEVIEGNGRAEVDVRLPVDYDQQDWEETVDTLVEISEEIGQYQDDLVAVTERYPE